MNDGNRLFPDETGWSADVVEKKAELEEVRLDVEAHSRKIVELQVEIDELTMVIEEVPYPSMDDVMLERIERLVRQQAALRDHIRLQEKRLKLLNQYISLATPELN